MKKNQSILDKINENREAMDMETPDSSAWKHIHQELHPEKENKTFPWMKLAAVFVIAAGAFWFLNPRMRDENKSVAEIETYVAPTWNDADTADTAIVNFDTMRRKVIRGGSWKDFRPFRGNVFKTQVTNQPYQDQTKSYIGFRTVLPSIGRKEDVSQFYMDQTEITNNEYRDFVTQTRTMLEAEQSGTFIWSFNDGSNAPVSVGNSTTLNAGNYSVTLTDVNACNIASTATGYDFSHDLNPDFVYVNGNTYLRNGVAPNTQEEILQEVDPGYYYEQYDEYVENKFIDTDEEAVTTFSIDVDGAGYSNMRRFITSGYLPPKNAVKLEEMINYFEYKLPEPGNNRPIAVTTELGNCPWNEKNQLFQICMKGKTIPQENYPASNLVFLIDVSGSMADYNKLPLLVQGFKLLVNQLREEDKVSIVVYAGAAGVVLNPTSGDQKEKIREALMNLNAGGSTAGGEGINLAYDLAAKHFIKGGNNRIILATDGDFNVGVTDDDALIRLVEEKRKSGIFLSVLGFGEGNLQSSKMEKIADNGNGNYSYIDNILEAKKVLVTEMGGTLHIIAKDVKLQLEFNPQQVKSYRLLGYENRVMENEDFANDLKDAGDMGSGHTIVAFYEIVPADGEQTEKKSDLKYQDITYTSNTSLKNELATIKFRYKEPTGTKSKLLTYAIDKNLKKNPGYNFQFASAVAELALLLRDSEYKANASFDKLIERAVEYKGKDAKGYRAEFIQLAEQAKILFEEYQQTKKKDK